jgi:hypothetical protein
MDRTSLRRNAEQHKQRLQKHYVEHIRRQEHGEVKLYRELVGEQYKVKALEQLLADPPTAKAVSDSPE